ncbi:Uncharacterized protein EbC_pEb17201670 (plasmid) [Erwinia billingiae Eb661]|uniref:Uncharacterized protein n=1 Tax=Erwinia billingiae (strain Eb661) TaxID=634500 RepID=D8MK22_ERWBE|nr:Uncharacterized protein EbC_pEb17201670 [Erwinia billingiae Eb661]
MNYAGYEELRADVAALSNEMCDLRTRLNGLESGWRWDSDSARTAGAADGMPHQRAVS